MTIRSGDITLMSGTSSSTERLYICSRRKCVSHCRHTIPHPHNDSCDLTCVYDSRCLLVHVEKYKIIISKSTAKSTREYMRNK